LALWFMVCAATNCSMHQSPSWEAESCSAGRRITPILWDL